MEEVSKSIKKEFDSKPLYNKKYLKTETKSYRRKTTTNFNEIPKEGSQRICLLAIFINSVFWTGKNYYPQVIFEEFKYVVTEKVMYEHITDDMEISSDSDREDFYEENSNKESFDEKNFDEENKYRMWIKK